MSEKKCQNQFQPMRYAGAMGRHLPFAESATDASLLLLLCLFRRASAAERPAEMSRRPTGQPRHDAGRAAGLLPAS